MRFITVILMALTFLGCSETTDDTNVSESSIYDQLIGTYNLNKVETRDLDTDPLETHVPPVVSGTLKIFKDKKIELYFKSGIDTVIDAQGEFILVMDDSLEESKIAFSPEFDPFGLFEDVSYIFDGSILIFTVDDVEGELILHWKKESNN